MNITAESYAHAVMLNIDGELTEDSLASFKEAVDHQLESEEVIDIVLNMENVLFVDSMFLEYLLELQDRLAAKLGQVKLVKIDDNIRKILEITRLDSTFEVCMDTNEAVKAVHV